MGHLFSCLFYEIYINVLALQNSEICPGGIVIFRHQMPVDLKNAVAHGCETPAFFIGFQCSLTDIDVEGTRKPKKMRGFSSGGGVPPVRHCPSTGREAARPGSGQQGVPGLPDEPAGRRCVQRPAVPLRAVDLPSPPRFDFQSQVVHSHTKSSQVKLFTHVMCHDDVPNTK